MALDTQPEPGILADLEQSNSTGFKPPPRAKTKSREKESSAMAKRRCVSTACIACRKRKSKCDGNTPICMACASVYGTECVYDPGSDQRRRGVYKKEIDSLKNQTSTLQTIIEAIMSYPEDEVPELIQQIRSSSNLDDVAESIVAKERAVKEEEDVDLPLDEIPAATSPSFETELSGKMGELRLENGSVRFIGGTSILIYPGSELQRRESFPEFGNTEQEPLFDDPITSWTTVTSDPELTIHLLTMYFTWHYAYFTTLSKKLFYRDFLKGKPSIEARRKNVYCTSLLVNAMLSLGCHFTSWPMARSNPNDSATAGDHFFAEAKRLVHANDELEKPCLTTVQALALMSVREAGCGREGKGWVYSGMSFRMACDLGLNLDSGGLNSNGNKNLDEQEVDSRRITFWGCFLFDKCWSNYLGRMPQLPSSNISVPKFEVFPDEDAETWSPYTDQGPQRLHSQPSRTRAVALQISALCEISSHILGAFYHPSQATEHTCKVAELKKLGELHQKLEGWRKNLPNEMAAKEGALSSVLLMHMFYQLLFIHLFRPFLRYNEASSPLQSQVSPRKMCIQSATLISKLLRLYKRTHGLRQICNVAVYISHSACTIHLLNLPNKDARRDIIHGVKHLEEIAESWLCARRTLGILRILAKRWKIDLPEEAVMVLARAQSKFGSFAPGDIPSPKPPISGSSPTPQSNDTSPSLTPEQNYTPLIAETHAGNSSNQRLTPEPWQQEGVPSSSSRSATSLPSPFTPPSYPAATLPLQHMMTQPHLNPGTITASGISITDENSIMIDHSQDWWMKNQPEISTDFYSWNASGANALGLSIGEAPGIQVFEDNNVETNETNDYGWYV
ncbi:MAG: hypothetical protein M1829_003186 [Trizodia sp. TS-e1964]|nr:MAG: hypothetical protein M1829_003186 [Trizodia sp. TS-e1964]